MKMAYFQLALSMCLVGINIAVGKIISQAIPVFLFANIRFVIATAVLVPLILYKNDTAFSLTRKDWQYLFLQAFFGIFLFSIFMLYGVRYTSAVSAGIITSTTPAWIAVIAFLFLRERLKWYSAVSVFLAVSGIALISTASVSNGTADFGNLIGNLLIVCAVISEALFTIFAKPVSTRISALQMTAIVNFFGFLLFIPFSLHTLTTTEIHIPNSIWMLILYYSLTASILSFLLWFRGITRVPANIAGLFTVFMPISSALAGIVILSEKMTARQTLGMLFAIIAICVGVYSHKRSADSNPNGMTKRG